VAGGRDEHRRGDTKQKAWVEVKQHEAIPEVEERVGV